MAHLKFTFFIMDYLELIILISQIICLGVAILLQTHTIPLVFKEAAMLFMLSSLSDYKIILGLWISILLREMFKNKIKPNKYHSRNNSATPHFIHELKANS